jgi:hypothetical protein
MFSAGLGVAHQCVNGVWEVHGSDSVRTPFALDSPYEATFSVGGFVCLATQAGVGRYPGAPTEELPGIFKFILY